MDVFYEDGEPIHYVDPESYLDIEITYKEQVYYISLKLNDTEKNCWAEDYDIIKVKDLDGNEFTESELETRVPDVHRIIRDTLF